MSNVIIHEARYMEQEIEAYKGNPLIEALPPILTPDDIEEKLSFLPAIKVNEKDLPSHLRIHCLLQWMKIFVLSDRHYELENNISLMIRGGYVGRNPDDEQYKKYILKCYELVQAGDINARTCHNTNSTAISTSLIGCSGVGKSTALGRVLGLYPQVIHHSDALIYQVVWLKLECPKDGSLVGLCTEFFTALDRILGSDYYSKYCTKRSTADQLLLSMCTVATLHAIGIIVIDEIQHLSAAKSGGDEKMLNFFVNLENSLGIPVLTVGTLKAQKLLQSAFRQARRSEGIGSMIWLQHNEHSEDWKYLLDELWGCQILRKPTKLTDEIAQCLFRCTQGITAVLSTLFLLAQKRAMDIGSEELSVGLITQVFDDSFKMMRPMLDALRNNDRTALEAYDDIRPPEILAQISAPTRKEKIIPIKEITISDKGQINLLAQLLGLGKEIVGIVWESERKQNPGLDATDLVHVVMTSLKKEPIPEKVTPIKKPIAKDLEENDLRRVSHRAENEEKDNYLVLKESGVTGLPEELFGNI